MSCAFDMVPETVDHLDGAELRRAFGCFPSGVIAVCAMVDGVPVGMAASSFASVSIDPPLVSICVQNTSTTWPRLRGRPQVGVSVLAEGHDEACRSLSRKEGDRFAAVCWSELPTGSVVIHGASAWLDCRLRAEIPAGDHLIALLKICALRADPDTPPLIFHDSRFRRLLVECR
ncbi:flavin reductase family protein [Mycobacterium decipiens]|uniref:Flavin reductase n=1 Tax=Mycobacterium decipiens TaxID=1430326 RepID=A0A1X2LQY7_9MYCO|nr:flavin reductase family protein [Mycobacterium decipiens]OSC38932.1 flavin reductase [Mycobacterium decipiens]